MVVQEAHCTRYLVAVASGDLSRLKMRAYYQQNNVHSLTFGWTIIRQVYGAGGGATVMTILFTIAPSFALALTQVIMKNALQCHIYKDQQQKKKLGTFIFSKKRQGYRHTTATI